MIKSICVYCGSKGPNKPSHGRVAEETGKAIGQLGLKMIYGGGNTGLMGMSADAAMAAGAEVIGIIPQFLYDIEVGHRGITELKVCNSMHERKTMFFHLSDAFFILPGGYGTLDELFEIITWKYLGMHDKPIIMINPGGFWDPVLALIEHLYREQYLLRIMPTVVSTVAQAFEELGFEVRGMLNAPTV
jgi:uncharacterized protein (TIGR00730 family)